jgi:hypothetical protein
LFVLSISPAFLSIDHLSGNSTVTLGGVSSEECLMVNSQDMGDYDNEHQSVFAGGMAGGFSFGSLVEGVKKILPGVKNVAKTIAGALESAGYGAGMTGAGMTGAANAQEKKMAAVMKKMKQMSM